MPELPEVETTRRGLLPHVVGKRVDAVVVRDRRLRWPVPEGLESALRGERISDVRRRGKYLVFDCRRGHLLVHLGMSGRLSLVPAGTPARAHDHVDVDLEGRTTLRLTDPRRFGAFLWLEGEAESHELLRHLGLEPLDDGFDGAALHRLSRGRATAIKHFLMDARVVTGVGNIYASEALFHAGIHPARPAGRISRARYDVLARAVRATLERALAAGGTTLRDFASVDGSLGHFQLETAVYGREGKPCIRCKSPVKLARQGQRSTYYCARCQH
jgi:formamidopyrimidine-DNA glycosylase